MKVLLVQFSIVLLVVLLTAAPAAATNTPNVTITLLTPLPQELAVGQSYTIRIAISSDTPFILAMAMPDTYYPGRGIFFRGSERIVHATEALLEMTVTGKASTADLAAVTDWPAPGDVWPAGVAPASAVAGVRFTNGQTVAERFNFAVRVP